MKQYWFKAKRYGWGWYPATWQGYAILGVFVIVEILDFLRLDAASHSASDTLRPFILQTLILGMVLICVCYCTGEPSRWRWGSREDTP